MQHLALAWHRGAGRVGFVPTMGYLHAGHLSLIKRARELIGSKGKLVVSVYVNPTQFGPHEDFSRYPRALRHDIHLCKREGADVLFAPTDEDIYPHNKGNNGTYSTYVIEEKLSRVMEGASRPTHFRGVTTVVAKLFNIVQPTVAIFGAKDYQQAAIIKRMAADLNFPIQIEVAPIYREPDGLAMSSRNKYLKGALRSQALVLWQAIEKTHAAVRDSGNALPAASLKRQIKSLVHKKPDARLDYVEFFDPDTLQPVKKVTHGIHIALAVFIGKTRLIDNCRL